MTRKVHRLKNLRSASFVDVGPFSKDPKLKGKALEGIRYGNRVHAELEELRGYQFKEQWIRFQDESGWHYCRPDSIIDTWDRVIVVEAKLSLRQLPKALAQLRLYRPLLGHIFNKPVAGIVAFKHWILDSDGVLPMIDHPELVLSMPKQSLKPALGWNYM